MNFWWPNKCFISCISIRKTLYIYLQCGKIFVFREKTSNGSGINDAKYNKIILSHKSWIVSTQFNTLQNEFLRSMLKGIQDIFLIDLLRYVLQLIFRLTPLTSAGKGNEKLVNEKLCNTVLILDALYIVFHKKVRPFQPRKQKYKEKL